MSESRLALDGDEITLLMGKPNVESRITPVVLAWAVTDLLDEKEQLEQEFGRPPLPSLRRRSTPRLPRANGAAWADRSR